MLPDFIKYISVYEIKENGLDGACGTCEGEERCIQFLWGKLWKET